MNNSFRLVILCCASAAGCALAEYKVEMNAIDSKGVGASVGTVTASAGPNGSVVLTPKLKGLPPGTHGFHVHANPDCGPKEKDGKMEAGEAAGGHYDPNQTKKHAGPAGDGHLGDVPPLEVSKSGNATKAVRVPRMKLADLTGKSLVVHEGGDNFSDQPKPNGGGGTRIACGVIK